MEQNERKIICMQKRWDAINTLLLAAQSVTSTLHPTYINTQPMVPNISGDDELSFLLEFPTSKGTENISTWDTAHPYVCSIANSKQWEHVDIMLRSTIGETTNNESNEVWDQRLYGAESEAKSLNCTKHEAICLSLCQKSSKLCSDPTAKIIYKRLYESFSLQERAVENAIGISITKAFNIL
jgi:hypothetical protein